MIVQYRTRLTDAAHNSFYTKGRCQTAAPCLRMPHNLSGRCNHPCRGGIYAARGRHIWHPYVEDRAVNGILKQHPSQADSSGDWESLLPRPHQSSSASAISRYFSNTASSSASSSTVAYTSLPSWSVSMRRITSSSSPTSSMGSTGTRQM